MSLEIVYKKKTNLLVIDALEVLDEYDVKKYCNDEFGHLTIGNSTVVYSKCKKNSKIKPVTFCGQNDVDMLTCKSGVVIIMEESCVDRILDCFPEDGVFIKNFLGEISFDSLGNVVGDMSFSFC